MGTDAAQWDRDTELARLGERGLSRQEMTIQRMYVVQRDLEIQMRRFAWWKAEHDRRKSKHVIAKRYVEGEKSGEMCNTWAEGQDDVVEADMEYRLAEQLVSADKSLLQIMHADLEKWRTEQANERAADVEHRRSGI